MKLPLPSRIHGALQLGPMTSRELAKLLSTDTSTICHALHGLLGASKVIAWGKEGSTTGGPTTRVWGACWQGERHG